VAALRDPYQRLVAELWARHAPAHADEPASIEEEPKRPSLRPALGWRP